VIALTTILFVGALWSSLVLWTWRDISMRSANSVERAAAVLTVALLFVVGYVVYRMFRPSRTLQERYVMALEEEAILQGLEDLKACGECGRRAADGYLYCPYCRAQLKQPCPSCAAAMEPAWSVCAYCGNERGRVPAIPVVAAAGG
jgi:hypothetical protein